MSPVRSDELLIELVLLHARALLRMPFILAGLVLGMALLVYRYVVPMQFIGWGVLTIGVEVLRALTAWRVLRSPQAFNPRRVHVAFALLAAMAGLALSSGAVLFMPRLPLLLQVVFGAVLFIIPAAGTAVAQASPQVLTAYALSIMLPTAGVWSFLYPHQAVPVFALTVTYSAVLVLVTIDGEKLLLRSVVIRHERDRLVQQLERMNADVHAAMLQAEQSAQARARVLAAASHDLRQPLHALSVYSAVLASKPAPDLLSEVSQNIDQIVRALGNLLHGLLDLSRLSAGNYVPERQNLALDTLIAGVCAEFQQPAAQKGLELVRQLSAVRVVGDSVAISRVARNLIDNAIKYTDSGSVRVSTACESRDGQTLALLRVADTGRGIPAAEQSRIFEEFYQLDNPGRDRSKGVGLGLAIVARLCELTGARIEVESTVGAGTCFSLCMPAVTGAFTPVEPVTEGAAEVSLRGKRVYVVDDEADILHSMCTLLGVWGMDTKTASTAGAALEMFERHGAPDLLLMDLRLGKDVHGAQLAESLRHKHGRFPLLIITGETASEALQEATSRNFRVLRKPIAPEVLRQAIATAMAASVSSATVTA
jgi:signal transduction histidine kinase/ActR/RegA family two-component response regulator